MYFSVMEPSFIPALLETYAPLLPLDDTGLMLHQAWDLFALWGAQEDAAGAVCPPPFWAIVWPANRLLSRYILENRDLFAGKSVLDIGCGCGAATIAAAHAGARESVGNDIDPTALAVARHNARANGVAIVTDNLNILENPPDRQFDYLLLADMFYEASATSPLFTFLRAQMQRGTTILIADANRPFTPRKHLQPLMSATFAVSAAVEGVAERNTTLYRLLET